MKQKQRILHSILYVPILLGMMFLCACGGGDDGEDGPVVNSDILNVESGAITIGGNELIGTIKILANCHWTIQKQQGSDGDWLMVDPLDGTGNATVTVTANSVNPSSTDSRKMTLILKSDGGVKKDITVTQTIASEDMKVSTETLSFDYQASSQQFTITSNASWNIDGKPDWISLSAIAGKGTETIEVTVFENTSETEARNPATLVITTVSGAFKRYVKVTQDYHHTTLTVNPLSISAAATVATYDVQLTGDATWTASTNKDWVNLNQTSGRGTYTLVITCDDNPEKNNRTAKITISYGNSSKDIEVTQSAGVTPVVSSVVVSDRTKDGVTLTSSFTSDLPVTKCGFCYGTTVNPTIDDKNFSQEAQGAKFGSFTQSITNLDAGLTYYVRAYAINAVGVAYSENVSFSTMAQIPGEDDNNMPEATKKR